MMYKHIYLFVFFSMITCINYSQDLNIDETTNYLNNLFKEYEIEFGPFYSVNERVMSIKLNFPDVTIYSKRIKSTITTKFNINDVEFVSGKVRIYALQSTGSIAVVIKCKDKDCIGHESELESNLYFHSKSNVLLERILNSFSHLQLLVSQIDPKPSYDPFDNYDPHANSKPFLVTKELFFSEQNDNNRIDQNEQVFILFDLINEGKGIAEDVNIRVSEKNNLRGLNYKSMYTIDVLNPGQTIKVKIPVEAAADIEIAQAEFKIDILIDDKYITNIEYSVPMFNSSGSKLVIAKNSQVDINIPKTNELNRNTYALVIGNEDYESRQNNLNKEANVDYAIKDARIFKEYLTLTYGIPEININYLVNATAAEMKDAVYKLKLLCKINNKANLIFYYAGHGLPLEPTNVQYLVPVDVNGSNLELGIKINDLINSLTEYDAGMVTIILDACFSGGGRNESLIANRSIKVKPKEPSMKGNVIVISASSDTESAGSYKENQHGLFTYYLLNKIQQTKGKVRLSDLYDFLSEIIPEKSILLNGQVQTPTLSVGPGLDYNWQEMYLFQEIK